MDTVSIKPKLGEMLILKQLITDEELNNALSLQKEIGGRLGALLIRIGAISEDALLETLSSQLDIPFLSRTDLPADYAETLTFMHASGIDIDWWLDQEVICWKHDDDLVRYISRDVLNISQAEIIETHLDQFAIQPCLARSHDIEHMLSDISNLINSSEQMRGGALLKELAEEAPVIEFVNNLLSQAFEQRASDIHVEPEKFKVQIRFRVDGVLYNRFVLPIERYNAIASRIKLISGMDISEHRLPQDGRIETRVSGQEIDIRVSALPNVNGESLVLRLLPKEKQQFEIGALGFSEETLQTIKRLGNEPHGVILVTGPTGSGKSTTLYSLLGEINNGSRKIITVEDPVEYKIEGITQVQTLSDIGYTFAQALRSILRQDPDVVMIGEIRDTETAEIAIQASLTGHLVLSTLHTNDAISAFTRLIDMGIEPFLVATPIKAVLAQRLVRKLCTECARPFTPIQDITDVAESIVQDSIRQEGANWREPVGCKHCGGTGYKGRLVIHELVMVTTEIQHAIVRGCSVADLKGIILSQGVKTLREDGYIKAYQGITSIDEVLRVTAE